MTFENLVKQVGEDWAHFLKPFMCPDDKGVCKFDAIADKLKPLYEAGHVYPDKKNLFRAFRETPLDKVRVVLLGQDPYPKEGYANGLAFATDIPGKMAIPKSLPPSLEAIYIAVEKDMYAGMDLTKPDRSNVIGKPQPDGTIRTWVSQGVLLLNTALTIGFTDRKGDGVLAATPGSHEELWKPFTDFVISNLWKVKRNLCYIAWGGKAKDFVKYELLGNDPIADNGYAYSKGVNVFHAFLSLSEHPAAALRANREWISDSFSKTNLFINLNHLGDPIEW